LLNFKYIMGPERFIIAATIVSGIIWFLNFSAQRVGNQEIEINGSLELTPEPGKLHVLVTGGAGYIGSHAVLQLLELGHAVTVIDNLSRGNLGALLTLSLLPSTMSTKRFRFLNVDLGNKAAVLEALLTAQPRIDLVMHFAAVAYVGESMKDPIMYYNNVTVNTVNLLHAMQLAQVHQLVYSSTCAVYGNQKQLPITEGSPPAPINPYGEAKLMAENVIRAFAKSDPRFRSIILRYFNVYGSDPKGRLGEYPRPELRHHARISGACLDAALGLVPALHILGTSHPTPDGTCIRDYIHVSDLISAHVAGMSHLANPPALYNVGTGKGVSVRQFVDACKRVTGVDITVKEQAASRPGDYAEVWADPAKINKELGWRANWSSIDDALAHAWAWRRAHPHGYG